MPTLFEVLFATFPFVWHSRPCQETVSDSDRQSCGSDYMGDEKLDDAETVLSLCGTKSGTNTTTLGKF